MNIRLCDIGNTTAHFFYNGNSKKIACDVFDPTAHEERIYYICVHPKHSHTLETLANWIDLAPFIDLENSYATLGVDRKLAAWYRHDGIVVDAGSAITVDKVTNGIFQGGFIYPGITAMQKSYANISKALQSSFNFELSFDKMPLTTQDAISYGAWVPLIEHIKTLASRETLVCTGGDGMIVAKMLDARYEKDYIFDAMMALIKETQC